MDVKEAPRLWRISDENPGSCTMTSRRQQSIENVMLSHQQRVKDWAIEEAIPHDDNRMIAPTSACVRTHEHHGEVYIDILK